MTRHQLRAIINRSTVARDLRSFGHHHNTGSNDNFS